MSDAATDTLAARRREAGDFLRSRRARLQPSDVGLSDGFRRRTPGLRREEVAMLAGVGTDWYAWLEQGRDVHPSAEMLQALATALRLDPTERRHLFVLCGRPVPERPPAAVEQIDDRLRRMLDGLTGQPAFVLGRRWDVLAWNRAAAAVYGPYDRLDGDERNSLHLVFADPDHRRLLVDWELVARASLAMFRADCARYAGDPAFERLVARLMRTSPEFAAWWPAREVAEPLSGLKRIDHSTAGRMLFEYASLGVPGAPDMKLIVSTPLAEADTAAKLDRLLAGSTAAGLPSGSPARG